MWQLIREEVDSGGESGQSQLEAVALERRVGRHGTGCKRLEAVLAEMYLDGFRTVAANTVAERMWPDGRRHNSQGQTFHLGAAIAARMLRRCRMAVEFEWRRWEILPPNDQHNRAPRSGDPG